VGVSLPVSFPRRIEGSAFGDYVVCRECGKMLGILTKAHVESHGMTKDDYCTKHLEHSRFRFWGDLPEHANPSHRTADRFKSYRQRARMRKEEDFLWKFTCGSCFKFNSCEEVIGRGYCKNNGKIKERLAMQLVCKPVRKRLTILRFIDLLVGGAI